jgi:hypothetical protein
VAGALGFTAGAIIGGALAQPGYPVYTAPVAPVVYVPQPWTPQWYAACSAKYVSFNPNTGKFKSKSGKWKFCQLP